MKTDDSSNRKVNLPFDYLYCGRKHVGVPLELCVVHKNNLPGNYSRLTDNF